MADFTTGSNGSEQAALAPLRPAPRAQWAALLAVTATALVAAFAVSAVAAATIPQDEVLATGTRVSAGGVSIEPAEGWVRNAESPQLLNIAKQGAKILIFPPEPSTQTATQAADELAGIFTGDQTAAAQVTPAQKFTTASGIDAAKAVVVEPTNVTLIYAFSDGGNLTKSSVALSADEWKELGDEIDSMMATVEFDAGSAT